MTTKIFFLIQIKLPLGRTFSLSLYVKDTKQYRIYITMRFNLNLAL